MFKPNRGECKECLKDYKRKWYQKNNQKWRTISSQRHCNSCNLVKPVELFASKNQCKECRSEKYLKYTQSELGKKITKAAQHRWKKANRKRLLHYEKEYRKREVYKAYTQSEAYKESHRIAQSRINQTRKPSPSTLNFLQTINAVNQLTKQT